jgi:CDP-diacylglycerol--glycerol-3-phosphate 3-phosphatidyltransferase
MKAGSEPVSQRVYDAHPMGKFWVIPNMFSLSRVLLLIPIFMFLAWGKERNGNTWAAAFMGLAALTDFLDGFTARRMNQSSRWGRILDPICDKICLLSIGIFLALPTRTHPLPVWFLALIIVRDLIILAGAYYVMGKFRHIPASMAIGKWTTFFMALLLISYTLEWTHTSLWLRLFQTNALLVICTTMVILSGLLYAYRTIRGNFPDSLQHKHNSDIASPTKAEVENNLGR